MTCLLDFKTVDPYPNVQIKPDTSDLFVNITTDVSCQRHANDTNLYHVANLIFLVNITMDVEIDTNLTIKGKINDLEATIIEAYNSTIGDISLTYI